MEDVSLQRPIIGDYGGEIHSPISPITSASGNVVVNKNIVVNFEVSHISAMYEGMYEGKHYQREALTDAINQGRKITNPKLGSLDSINEPKQAIDNIMNSIYKEKR